MSKKLPHDYADMDGFGTLSCKHCGIVKYYVDTGIVSRRCTQHGGRLWAGKNAQNESIWVKGEYVKGQYYPSGAVGCYDPEYDMESGEEEKAPAVVSTILNDHVMGLSPESVDWEAHKAFLGEQR
jgi:hypothetical protein